MSKTISNVKLQLRKDILQNWQNANPILKDGEVAIVKCDNIDKLKVGNGISAFNELPYFSEEYFETKELKAQSIAQGMYTNATPTSLATGIFTEASANFGIVHGIEAQILSTDNYAFVFNGTNLPGILDRYVSHGEGTFNINPLNGLSGFYIGEQNLCSILSVYLLSNEISNYYIKSETSSSNEIETALFGRLLSTDITFNYDSNDKKIRLKAFDNEIGNVDCTDFIKDGMLSTAYLSDNVLVLVFNTDSGKTDVSVNLSNFVDNYNDLILALSNAISTIGEDYLDSNDKIELYNDLLSPDEILLYKGPGTKDISLSVGTGTLLSTYTVSLSDFYLSSETSSSAEIADKFSTLSTYTEISNLLSNNGYLTSHQSLVDYYKTNETSSASQISTAFNSLSDTYSLKTTFRDWSA